MAENSNKRIDSQEKSFTLMEIIKEDRKTVWKNQSPAFFDKATINCDGTIVSTEGECKEGMDISYKGEWG